MARRRVLQVVSLKLLARGLPVTSFASGTTLVTRVGAVGRHGIAPAIRLVRGLSPLFLWFLGLWFGWALLFCFLKPARCLCGGFCETVMHPFMSGGVHPLGVGFSAVLSCSFCVSAFVLFCCAGWSW
jgi:hypothetical protein